MLRRCNAVMPTISTPFADGSDIRSATPTCGRFAATVPAPICTTFHGFSPTITCTAAATIGTSTWCNRTAFIKLLKAVGFNLFYVEVARDFVDRTQDLYDDFKKYFVQPRRRNAPVHYKGTAYGAPRNTTVNFVFYPKYSDRLKAHSLHREARLNGRKVLERAGITCVTDLLHFDFNDYWERKLVLRKVNLDRLSASVRGGRREARVLYAAEGRQSQRLMFSPQAQRVTRRS